MVESSLLYAHVKCPRMRHVVFGVHDLIRIPVYTAEAPPSSPPRGGTYIFPVGAAIPYQARPQVADSGMASIVEVSCE